MTCVTMLQMPLILQSMPDTHAAQVVAELKVSEVTLDGGEVLVGSAVDDPGELPKGSWLSLLCYGGMADCLLDDELCCLAAES